jgi:hypothetical protein
MGDAMTNKPTREQILSEPAGALLAVLEVER